MSDDIIESPQSAALAVRGDFLRKWVVDSVISIGDINTDSTLELYEDTARNVIKCRISSNKTPGRNAYCKTSGCVSSWESADFTFANGIVTGSPGGVSGRFSIIGQRPLQIQWFYDQSQAKRTPLTPGGSWNGTED